MKNTSHLLDERYEGDKHLVDSPQENSLHKMDHPETLNPHNRTIIPDRGDSSRPVECFKESSSVLDAKLCFSAPVYSKQYSRPSGRRSRVFLGGSGAFNYRPTMRLGKRRSGQSSDSRLFGRRQDWTLQYLTMMQLRSSVTDGDTMSNLKMPTLDSSIGSIAEEEEEDIQSEADTRDEGDSRCRVDSGVIPEHATKSTGGNLDSSEMSTSSTRRGKVKRMRTSRTARTPLPAGNRRLPKNTPRLGRCHIT